MSDKENGEGEENLLGVLRKDIEIKKVDSSNTTTSFYKVRTNYAKQRALKNVLTRLRISDKKYVGSIEIEYEIDGVLKSSKSNIGRVVVPPTEQYNVMIELEEGVIPCDVVNCSNPVRYQCKTLLADSEEEIEQYDKKMADDNVDPFSVKKYFDPSTGVFLCEEHAKGPVKGQKIVVGLGEDRDIKTIYKVKERITDFENTLYQNAVLYSLVRDIQHSKGKRLISDVIGKMDKKEVENFIKRQKITDLRDQKIDEQNKKVIITKGIHKGKKGVVIGESEGYRAKVRFPESGRTVEILKKYIQARKED